MCLTGCALSRITCPYHLYVSLILSAIFTTPHLGDMQKKSLTITFRMASLSPDLEPKLYSPPQITTNSGMYSIEIIMHLG